ncbi:hypothetical protein P0Y35_14710 [Kiritimatiellaeota bacterium B1221]|nr:hypothetical protein [Kiritimatiellaeota bacterium B1221]
MDNAILYLAPVFLTQILLGVLLLWLFVKERDQVGLGTILLTSLLYTALNIVIEWFLHDFLLATTLVVQWTFFVLLAQRILSIPLPRASVTLFCYFSLLMGVHMAQVHFTPPELTEDEKLLVEGFEETGSEAGQEALEKDWVQRLQSGSLAHKTYASKDWVLDFIYPSEKNEIPEEDPLPILPEAIAKTPPRTAAPENTALPVAGMTGQEFEKLFFPELPADPASPESIAAAPLTTEIAFVNPPLPEPANLSINARQMSQIVEVKNRSTDPGYPAPDYSISAVGVGAGGRFIIVNGDMLKEGSIIYTQHENPRGWKLYKVKPTLLYWQPLK